ncbi:arylesterase [Kordiimonas marina]|uniref:arylesterase n=1 Tax=Kordiimonas marina TaxID=2872312 RepID=UPI001FF6889F|nr:arylesterase [Kordiimonas marina]MCJ9428349.1 arylesterase [Kordiimonas marina]
MPVNRQRRHFLLFSALFTLFCTVFAPAQIFAADKAVPAYRILAFGDSLTAGYGLNVGEGFTEVLQAWLTTHMGKPVEVVNGGVSGDTSTGGRSRLDWALGGFKDGKPDLVILELGANDGLRGVDPHITAGNIDAMVKTLTDRGIKVLVAGMKSPPNLGQDYADVFDPIYETVAKKYGAMLYPFFLDGVAANPALNQADGLHPNPKGVKIVVGRIGPVVQAALLR